MVVPVNMSSEGNITPPENMGIFQTTEAASARPAGIAIAIALLVLFACFLLLFGVGIHVQKRAAQQTAQAAIVKATPPSARRGPRSRLFPLSLPSLGSRANITRSSSTEHMLTSLPLHKDFSETTTLASSSKSAKSTKSVSSDLDLEAHVPMPLPPPPSYQDINVTGPVRSISGSSWITEGPMTVDEPVSQLHGGGRRGLRGIKRKGGDATRRL